MGGLFFCLIFTKEICMETNRVAVTGISAMCGLGNSLDEVWNNLIEGKSGISTIEGIDPATTRASV